ncbi:unnamed protein product [Nezara viridula]|uniref:Uncharacterized protein n=1 Tax=Nezara viridula TaxID=85310 RepID=A0A9P0HU59_NEZVI|nr:unnamed protein product [Nezara viridula]
MFIGYWVNRGKGGRRYKVLANEDARIPSSGNSRAGSRPGYIVITVPISPATGVPVILTNNNRPTNVLWRKRFSISTSGIN